MAGNKSSQELHAEAVQKIAEELFTFPDSQVTPGVFHPTWVTYTNAPKQQMPIQHRWMGELHPDIVIVDTAQSNRPMLIAEVATKEDLTMEKALQARWKPDMDECSIFYVIVPEGCARQASNMILDTKLCYPTALFTYGFDDDGNLRLTPV